MTQTSTDRSPDPGSPDARSVKTVNHSHDPDRRIMFDNSPLGIIRFDPDGSIIDFNRKFVEQMGSTRESLVGFNTATRSSPQMQAAIKKALNGEESIFEGEYTSITGNKTSHFRVVFNPVNPGVSPTQVIATVEDITKRVRAETQLQQSHDKLERLVRQRTSTLIRKIEALKQTEDALRKSEEKYRSILDSIEDVYFEADLKGRLVFFNRASMEFLGYPESALYGMSYRAFTDPYNQKKLRDTFTAVYETGTASPLIDCTLIRKDKRAVSVSFKAALIRDKQGNPSGFQGLARDVTRQRVMENRLQHSQKMEAIGSLAGGVAHDFNNILGAIMGYAHLIKKHRTDPDRVLSYTDQILKAGDRSAGLVKQILLFSRETKAKKEPSDLGQVVREALTLLRATIPATIQIEHRITEAPFIVMADETQIHQVLMNLCANASHAMQKEGGTLEICLENLPVSLENKDQFFDLSAGKYLHLRVSDTGCGMDPETVKRIFEPYFTTKAAGEGTGLGLATVHGIVKEHDGVILIQSQINRGTVCDIYLPAVERAVAAPEEFGGFQTGSERILFVDDEAYLTDVGKEMLEDFGYRVDAFTRPVDALEQFKTDTGRYDLVITDYTMPAMTGEQLARQIRELNPLTPVIMCTGITPDMIITRKSGIKEVLMKPLDMEKLLRTIRSVLDQER